MNQKNKSFSISLIGFDSLQTEIFLAVLSLAERALQHSWRIVETDYADFFLLSTHKSESAAVIAEKKLRAEHCLFCSEQETDDKDVLVTDSKKMPRLGLLVKLLNHAATAISDFPEPIPAAHNETNATPLTAIVLPNNSNNDVDFFDPDWGFLGHLLHESNEPLVFGFNHPSGCNKLYVNRTEKIYYCETNLNDLGAYLIHENAIVAEQISAEAWCDAIKQVALPAKPLSNLIWYITYKLSNGRLLRGHSDQDSVYLTRWPDLGIQGCGQYVKIAAFMRHNALPLPAIAKETSTPLPEVYNFYNACSLIGIVQKTANPELHTKILDENKQNLLTKITTRLKEIDSRKDKVA